VGTYTVEAEHSGFKRYVRTGVDLTHNQIVRLNIALELGAITETVNVSAAVSPVNTTTAAVETLVETKQMLDLPVVGRRNVLSLAALMPSVTRVALSDGPGQQLINVNGLRSYSSNVTLDGASMYHGHRGQALMQPPPEALQEVKIVASGVGAEFGRGGAAVSVITRGGTNEFRGSVWNYLRNDALDARSFFATSVPKLRYNQFGGTVGGPIQHNRAFFFFAFQGVEQRSDQVQSSAFPPTEAERAGDFSNTRDDIPKDPLTGAPFPNNVIPTTRFDPWPEIYWNCSRSPINRTGRTSNRCLASRPAGQ
jgi:outer membrane receptor protein involved in Fe transport